MGVAYLEFRGENFRGWLKNREIRESFLPRKFSAIRYFLSNTVCIGGSSIGAQGARAPPPPPFWRATHANYISIVE